MSSLAAAAAGGGNGKAGAGGGITLRIRTQLGTWRLAGVHPQDSMEELRRRIESEHRADLEGRPLTADAAGTNRFRDSDTVGGLKLENGAMLYAMVDETKSGIHEMSSAARQITKEGNIVAAEYQSVSDSKGFRPGMMPLRNMKMQWTLNEFVALDSQFEFHVKKQPQAFCTAVSLDEAVADEFHNYMCTVDYQCMRVGFLYGKFLEDNSVHVDFIYEPPQSTTDTTFELLEDPRIDTVEALASMLGRRRVGWIFAHPTREDGFFLSGAEVIEASEQQLLAAGDIAETPFVTVKYTINTKNEAQADAFQISKQGMEMAAEHVLQLSPNLGMCGINPTFTAIVDIKNAAQKTTNQGRGLPASEVETATFIAGTGVPIKRHKPDTLISLFPRCNRAIMQAGEDLKRQISKVGQKGWTLLDLLSDFHVLLYLASSGVLSMEDDMPHICKAVVDRTPIGEGHTLLIRSLAGLDM